MTRVAIGSLAGEGQLSILPCASHSTCTQPHTHIHIVHTLMVELQEEGCDLVRDRRWVATYRECGSQVNVVVGPAPAGGVALPFHVPPPPSGTRQPQCGEGG